VETLSAGNNPEKVRKEEEEREQNDEQAAQNGA
jgi:hypothetical protein